MVIDPPMEIEPAADKMRPRPVLIATSGRGPL